MSVVRRRIGHAMVALALMAVWLTPTTSALGVEYTETHTSTIPLTPTNWTLPVDAPQFDPALGDLIDVTVSLDSEVASTLQVENLSTSSTCNATLVWGAEITASPSFGEVMITPIDSQDVLLAVYDGVTDFDGPSGASFANLAAESTGNFVYDDPAILDIFTGTGVLTLPVNATALTIVTGCGTIAQLITTLASVTVTVEYRYDASPAIDIEKATNGEDADNPTGPEIPVGGDVTWTYVVTNTGNVALSNVSVVDDQGVAVSCPQDTLVVAESMTCTGNGTAEAGQYANLGTTEGTGPNGTTVTDSDPSHYIGFEPDAPAIDIEKATNGEDADDPTGPEIPVGGDVTWTYVVTNTGNVALSNVSVVDDQGVAVTCPQDTLVVAESMTCTGNGTAEAGQYANLGTTEGTAPSGAIVTDEDPSHYFGVVPTAPAIDIEKATNGEDADNPTGPEIPVGGDVIWTYVVTNIGSQDLSNVVVTDDQGVAVSCPQDTLVVAESMTCTGNGTAEAGQYANVGDVSGVGTDGSTVTDEDPSHYFGVVPTAPAIDIEKATNGEDADNPTGPEIPVGGDVIWTYVVTNIGSQDLSNVVVTDDQGVAVSCPQDTLVVAESMTCTGNGTAEAGQYANVGDVSGVGTDGSTVTDEDPSHYFGVVPTAPAIDIEKATNGEDADNPTGPEIPEGDPVTWTYVVTNTGDVDLSNVSVVDDQGVAVSCPQDTLVVGESMTCTGNGTAELGQYANIGSTEGTAPDGTIVTDEDPSHYFGVAIPDVPAIDIEKATNGEDADNPTGPLIPEGGAVTWTYVVTNTGDVDLSNVSVTDDRGVAVTCPQDTLAVGESMTCTGNGTAKRGQYANIGTTEGTAPDGTIVTDEDPSHYYGFLFWTWLDCSHGDVGCLGVAGQAPAPVEVYINGELQACETSSKDDSGTVRFNCMYDSRNLPPIVDLTVYAGGRLLWSGTDLPTVCEEASAPAPDDSTTAEETPTRRDTPEATRGDGAEDNRDTRP